MATIGRRGRDYFRRRSAPTYESFEGVWDDLGMGQARRVARSVLAPFLRGEVDAIYVIYTEFKSAMTQQVNTIRLLPLKEVESAEGLDDAVPAEPAPEYIFEPSQGSIFERLVPIYIEITLLRALFDSVASELGARMTAMDSATKNAKEMISKLTLAYNRQRQAVITTELIEIIAGSEALQS
jgi:F-type H+-transporting ATPase subunit gamma